MGVADAVSRRGFLGLSAVAGMSLTLDRLVSAQTNYPCIMPSLVDPGFFATLVALASVQDKREKVPDDKSIKDAETEGQNLFKEEYKAKKPEFADSLLSGASKQTGATRYVALRDAAQISADNFKLSNTLRALEQLIENYQLKLDPIASEALKSAKKGVKSQGQAIEFAELGLKLADLGMKWNDYDMAVRAATEAKSIAPNTGDQSLLDRATEKLKEAGLLKKAYDEFVKAEKVFADMKPEHFKDAAKVSAFEKASLVAGKWYCLKENKWDVGIYALRTSSDKDLADIAKKEIDIKEKQDKGAELKAENFFDVAEAWYNKGKKESDQRDKLGYNNRAVHWYEKALPTAGGFLEPKVKMRIDELRKTGGGTIVDLLKMIDLQKDAVVGKWELKDRKLVSDNSKYARIQIPYQPPEEYDFRITFSRMEGEEAVVQFLTNPRTSFTWNMGAFKNIYFGFANIKSQNVGTKNETTVKSERCLENKHVYTSVVQVRKDGVAAYLDGRLIAQYKTDYKDWKTNPLWALRDESLLGVGTFESPTIFHRIEVVEVTGKGKSLR